jgi:aspartate-semialdehyde dehydrogenase
MERMREENDFKDFEPVFFTTSNVGGKGPKIGMDIPLLRDAYDTEVLFDFDIIVTCQGSDHTKRVYPELQGMGWNGFWLDSSSALRMEDESIIVLDPVNRSVIDEGLRSGVKTFVGGNCTVSLMLMALNGLFQERCVDWLSSMTYQAASGAGAKNMKELVSQMVTISDVTRERLDDPASTALEIDALINEQLRNVAFPISQFGAPLAASLIPWIDRLMDSGQTREEWKGYAETNKILQLEKPVPVDGLCVRIGAMRSHSQAFTIRLNKDIPLDEITDMIQKGNDWVRVVPNDKELTLKGLTPAAVNGTLEVPVGRLRKLMMGPDFLTAFTVGDQLLWGAAEPIRRMLNIIIEYLS